MVSLIAENVVQVVAYYRSGGDIVENVYYVHKGSSWSAPEILDVLGAFESWESTSASLRRSENVNLFRLVGTDLTSLTSDRVDLQLATPVDGQVVSPVLPNNVTFALKANIGERGKGRNGRKFWIGLAENQVIGSTMDTAQADFIQSSLNTLITDVATAVSGAALGVIHTKNGPLPITPATFSAIDSFTYTDLTTDSQRDRLPGHKRHKKPA